MSDQLREAIGHTESRRLRDPIVYRSHDLEVLAAARRWLALTETGPDYEAACWALVDSHAVDAITEIGGLTLGDVILAVDAALADYLVSTEGET